MKTILDKAIRAVRTATAVLALAALMMLNSCGRDSADISDLMKTVPSTASAVVGFNLHSMLEKSGCKVEGSTVTPGPDAEEWIKRFDDKSVSETVKLMLSGETGIDPNGAILFMDGTDFYLTAVLADTRKFEEFAAGQFEREWTEEAGVRVLRNMAITGSQLWIEPATWEQIDAKRIADYSSLSVSQSFAANPASEKIMKLDHDVAGWSIQNAFTQQLPLQQRALAGLINGMIYDSAASSEFYLDFEKGKATARGLVLNDEGKPAKFLLPTDKIDTGLVKGLGEKAGMVVAMAIPSDLVDKITKMASSMGGNSFGPVLDGLKAIDGTVAVATAPLSPEMDGYSAVVSTDGKSGLDLLNLLGSLGNTRKDGKLIYLTNGTVTGGLDVTESADIMKGCTFGLVMDLTTPALNAGEFGVGTLSATMRPYEGSVEGALTVTSTQPDENILLTLLKHLDKLR